MRNAETSSHFISTITSALCSPCSTPNSIVVLESAHERQQATAVSCSTGQSSSTPDMLDLPASLVENKLSAYAVPRAVRLAPSHIVLRRPASLQMLAHIRAENSPHA